MTQDLMAPRSSVSSSSACSSSACGWSTRVFNQKFTDFDHVTLKTDTIGLQLPERADVKMRGVIVGEVLEVEADGDGATLDLGIKPDQIGTIPGNVTASILPKTLFGEKYVELNDPRGPGRRPRSRPATRSTRPSCRSRSRRSSTTSTRCCAPSSPPSSTTR